MHKLPELLYDFNDLEPHMDAKTVEIHYTKHHNGYIDKLNTALDKYPELQEKSIEELLKNLDTIPEDIRDAVKNNGGGHYNHTNFWLSMGKPNENKPNGQILDSINQTFGSFDEFKQAFTQKAATLFASGWVWLEKEADGNLAIEKYKNHEGPLMYGKEPVFCIDVWEHAYYLKYQNKRAEFIDAWWNLINWDSIEKFFV